MCHTFADSYNSLQLQNWGVLSVIRIQNKPGYVAVEMNCEKIVLEVLGAQTGI